MSHDRARRASTAVLEVPFSTPDRRPLGLVVLVALYPGQNRDIAEQVGVSASFLGGILSGRILPGADLRARLAEVMGRTEAELFGDELVGRIITETATK